MTYLGQPQKIILHSNTIASPLSGRGCAILYKSDVYNPQIITSSINIKQDGVVYRAAMENNCVSDDHRMYAHLTNKSTGKSFFLVSVHLDYKISHSETEGHPEATREFAKDILDSIDTKEPVFIMGDWNAPCPSDDPHFIGSNICTNPDSPWGSGSFVFTDPMFGNVEKSYDSVYVNKPPTKATFKSDAFIKGKDGAAIFVKEACIKEIGLIPQYSYASQASFYLGLSLLFPVLRQALVKPTPLFTLLGTAVSAGLMWYGCKATLVPEIQEDYIKHSQALSRESYSLVK